MHSTVSATKPVASARSFVLVLTLAAGLFTVSQSSAATMRPLVIYGDDNRMEVYEDKDAARQILAESVVAIMSSEAIEGKGTGPITLKGGNYGDDNMLCPTERFVEQSAPAYCSGFLVAENIVATAGHCVQDADFCKDAKFVFGFAIDKKGRDPNQVTENEIYSCKKVLHDQMGRDGSDFALVELDRKVVGREPLTFAKKAPHVTDSVFVIGHPTGLPAKIADGAKVRENDAGFFVANLDTFSGNSGSAVFNENYEVAGILVRGENDFVRKGSCYISNRCKDEFCRGEDVTNPDIVASALDKILTGSSNAQTRPRHP